jgi:SAM-dependent methyltransferase
MRCDGNLVSGKFVNRFSGKAENYAKYRPGYPPAILDILEEEIAFDETTIVADVGSGTGLLSQVFLENGNKVFGIEPNNEMRAFGEKLLSGWKNFLSVKGTAEHTNLEDRSVDLVSAGQALHWFDRDESRKEFARILTTGNVLIVYNERNKEKKGAMQDYEKITGKHTRRMEVPDIDDDFLSKFFRVNYKKFAVPIFALIMPILSVPFAFIAGSRGAMTGVWISFLIAIAYWTIGTVFEQVGDLNQLPAIMAAWSPDVIFSCAGLYMMARMRT